MVTQHSYLLSFVSPVFIRRTANVRCLPNVTPLRRLSVARSRWSHRRQQPIHMSTSAKPSISIETRDTTPIEGQKTGTSGLRRRTSEVIRNERFVPNFVQSLFNALGGQTVLNGKTLVLGGDGRYYNVEAIQIIIRMAAANGFANVVVGRNGILSTPAVSALIPNVNAFGGIVLTASHNPGGVNGDWGIKFNTHDGAPALEMLTNKIYEETCRIGEYHIANFDNDVDLSVIGTSTFFNNGSDFSVQVIDPVRNYRNVLENVFDLNAIRKLLERDDFDLCFDAMHAVTGEYAKNIFVDLLGANSSSILRGNTLPDFGGGHPDPNLTYAKDLVVRMNASNAPKFGAASDGDGDRNMILGDNGVFVNPADSVAIIADHAMEVIPYFRNGLKGVARSMPTASALDRVARKRNIPLYETPTGWKFFSNLMDAGLISICGEESFGTGSNHIREKDGLWAVMCWLSILAHKNLNRPLGELFTVKDVLLEHWNMYGRTYALRHDYENVSASAGADVMNHMRRLMELPDQWPSDVSRIDEFEYVDPVDGSIATKQGVRIFMKNNARIVIRLSGTGSMGATVRIYFETYEPPTMRFTFIKCASDVLEQVVQRAKSIAKLQELTGREEPTVIT